MPSPILIIAILLQSRAISRVTRVAWWTIESRAAGMGVFDSGSSCSHIYYPGSWTGTNEFLIIRVGARSIQTGPLCTDRPFETTCYIDSCLIHRPALYEKSGVAPDVKDFLVRRKEIGLLHSFFLLLPAAWIIFKVTHPRREQHTWLKWAYTAIR